jgi:hypothetical protein
MKMISIVREARNLKSDSEATILLRAIIIFCAQKKQSLMQVLNEFANRKLEPAEYDAVFKAFIKGFASADASEFDGVSTKLRKLIFELKFDGDLDTLLDATQAVVDAINHESEPAVSSGGAGEARSTVEAMIVETPVVKASVESAIAAEEAVETVATVMTNMISRLEQMAVDVPAAPTVVTIASGGAASGSSSGFATVFASSPSDILVIAAQLHKDLCDRSDLYALLEQLKTTVATPVAIRRAQFAIAEMVILARTDEQEQKCIANLMAAFPIRSEGFNATTIPTELIPVMNLIYQFKESIDKLRAYKNKGRSLMETLFQSEKIEAKTDGANHLLTLAEQVLRTVMTAYFVGHMDYTISEVENVRDLATVSLLKPSEFTEHKKALTIRLEECQKLPVPNRKSLPIPEVELIEGLAELQSLAIVENKMQQFKAAVTLAP